MIVLVHICPKNDAGVKAQNTVIKDNVYSINYIGCRFGAIFSLVVPIM